MEVAARKKFGSFKDKSEPFFGAPGLQITLWRPWSFFLLLGCLFVITGGSYWSSYGTNTSTPLSGSTMTSMTFDLCSGKGWFVDFSENVVSARILHVLSCGTP